MTAFQQLDKLLSGDEEQYYANDSFLEAEDLIQALTIGDVYRIAAAWNERDSSLRNRFAQACALIQRETLESLLEILVAQPLDAGHILSLVARLPNSPDPSALRTSVVAFATSVWHSSPDLHRQAQMCTWACGLSGQLLRELHFKSWKEAGL